MVDPVTYKKLTYDGNGIQVESAIRDGNGMKIDTNYLKKSKVWVYEYELASTDTGSQTVSLAGIPDGTSPRIVQVFKKDTNTYELIQTDASLSLSSSIWYCTLLNKPADSGIWTVRIFGWADTL
jgi:hypothetical protein